MMTRVAMSGWSRVSGHSWSRVMRDTAWRWVHVTAWHSWHRHLMHFVTVRGKWYQNMKTLLRSNYHETVATHLVVPSPSLSSLIGREWSCDLYTGLWLVSGAQSADIWVGDWNLLTLVNGYFDYLRVYQELRNSSKWINSNCQLPEYWIPKIVKPISKP